MKPDWAWLRDDKNRDILKMAAAGIAALAAASWAVITFFGDHHQGPSVSAGAGGMAAGHDISGNSTITLAPPASPPGASAPPAKP